MTWLRVGCSEAKRSKRRDLTKVSELVRSQSLRSTAAARGASRGKREGRAAKTGFREGSQEGGCVKTDKVKQAPTVRQAKQGVEAPDLSWAEGTVWTEHMISALVNGVRGGRWFSLIGL